MSITSTILIADPQPLFCEGLAALLTRSDPDITVEQADRFSAAVNTLSSNEAIGLAIVNLDLPGLGGVPGLRQLRAHHPGVRVAAIAAELQRDLIVECLRAGVHGCVSKAMLADEIVEAVHTIGQGRILFVPNLLSEEPVVPARAEEPKLLSERQREVLTSLATGKSNKEIGRELGIAEGTVKVHVNAVFRALGVRNRICAAAALRDLDQARVSPEPPLPGLFFPVRQVAGQRQIA